MKDLASKFKPVLKKEGIFYPNPRKEDPQCIIVLEEINREAKCMEDHLNKKREVLGFNACYKTTGNPYPHNAIVSKEIGNPRIYLIADEIDGDELVDYATDLELARDKAHEYLFNRILERILNPYSEVCNSLLDTTEIGREKFKNNKANLSAQCQ